MTDLSDRERGLSRLLAATARAHHEATGGTNSHWPAWYAAHLVGSIDEFVGFSPDATVIEEWLIKSDERHQAVDPDGRWPAFYARYILEELAGAH